MKYKVINIYTRSLLCQVKDIDTARNVISNLGKELGPLFTFIKV